MPDSFARTPRAVFRTLGGAAALLMIMLGQAQWAVAAPGDDVGSSTTPSAPPTVADAPTAVPSAAPTAPDGASHGHAAPESSSLSLTKSVSPVQVNAVGQVLTYHFVATNTGRTTLSLARIADELPGLGPLDCAPAQPATLTPDDTLDCTATRPVTQDDLDFGAIGNVAEVSAEAPDGDPDDPTDDVTAIADASVDARQHPALALTAHTDIRKAAVGDRLTATFELVNTGNVTLTRARVQRGLSGLSALTCTPPRSTLAPGATLSCSGRYTVTKADARRGSVTVRGTARAEHPYGEADDSSDDVVATAAVKVSVVKSVPAPGGGGGGQLPDTGGPSPWLGLLGLALSAAGAALLVRRSSI